MLKPLLRDLMTLLRLPIYAILGLVMTFAVGLPLLLGGRFEGLIPLALGILALHGLRKEFRELRERYQ